MGTTVINGVTYGIVGGFGSVVGGAVFMAVIVVIVAFIAKILMLVFLGFTGLLMIVLTLLKFIQNLGYQAIK